MFKKIVSLGFLSITITIFSAVSSGHSGQWLVDSAGKKISDSSGRCIKSDNGVNVKECEPAELKSESAPMPMPSVEPEPAPVLVSRPMVMPEPEPEPTEVRKVYTLAGDALFDTSSARLSAEGKEVLDKFVINLNSAENLQVSKIEVVGHTDSRGNDDYNQALSERRASTVGNYLISKGIDASLIAVSGRGERDPIASNSTIEGRAKNRRVHINLSGIQVFKQ